MTADHLIAWDTFLVRAPVRRDPASPPADDPTAVLRDAAADPALREAVTLASPSLAAVLRRLDAGEEDHLRPKQVRRATLALLRYGIRMRTRPTPFGLFAGVAAGRFVDGPAVVRRGDLHRTSTRVDMGWLLGIVHRLETDPTVLAGLRVRVHQAVGRRGDRVVLDVPSALGAAPGREARAAVAVRETPVLRRVLAAAGTGADVTELVRAVAADVGGADPTVVLDFVARLVAQELLLTDLRPPLDGGDPLEHVLGVLRRVAPVGPDAAAVASRLRSLRADCAAYDALPIGAGRPALEELLGRARALEPHDTPLHVDTALDLEVALPLDVRDEVQRAADLLWRLAPPRLGMRPLRGYHQRFLERYGVDRGVPVDELLDDARGLGAPPGYAWPPSEAPEDAVDEPRTVRRAHVLARLAATALREGRREVVLDDQDVADLVHEEPDPIDLPSSCELYVHVTATSTEALADGRFRVSLSPSPGSHHAGATAGRFLALDDALRDDVVARRAATPPHVDGAFAVDLAFMPRSGKAANLAHTPAATGRRLVVGLPDDPAAGDVALGDLLVAGTLERLVLVHVPSGREVVPVLPSMVSPSVQAPNVVRLLWEIGMEGQRLWEPWSWGASSGLPFLPRVRHGRVVLAPATWRVDDLREHVSGADERWDAAVDRWRSAWDLPRVVLAVASDQRLELDLDDAHHRAVLRDEVARDLDLVVHETPAGPDDDALHPDLGHTTELVVGLGRPADAPRRSPVRITPPPTPRPDVHRPGGTWLYLKVPVPRRGQDELLRTGVPVLVEAARRAGAGRFFFLRYTEDGRHQLRLRLQGDERLWHAVLPAVEEVVGGWVRAGLAGGLALDEYDPELERYGGSDALSAAEELFEADSACAIALLRVAAARGCPYDLDELAAISVTALLDAFGPPASGDDRWVAPEARGDAAAAWLTMTGDRRDLPEDYRSRAVHWRALLDPQDDWPALRGDPHGALVVDAVRARDRAVADYAARLRELEAAGVGRTPLPRVVGSLMHMTCNRLIGGASARELAVLGTARGTAHDHARRRAAAAGRTPEERLRA